MALTAKTWRRRISICLSTLAIPLLLCRVYAADIDPQDQRLFADGLYVRGLYDMAADEYARLLNQAPDYEERDVVFFRLGECFRRTGNADQAAAYYEQIAAMDESEYRSRARFRHAELFVRGGQFDRAVQLLEALSTSEMPDEVAAAVKYNLGYSLVRAGEKEKAVGIFQALLDDYPGSEFFSYGALELGTLLRERGSLEEAQGLFLEAAKRPATPRVGAEGWFQWAEAAFQREAYEDSARGYGELLTQHPGDLRVDQAKLRAAWSFYHVGRVDDALDVVTSAIDGAGEDQEADWLYLKANCERALSKPGEASATYELLVSRHADSPLAGAAAYERALMAFKAGDYKEAVQRAERVTDPSDEVREDLAWLLAESHRELGNVEAAMKHYRSVAQVTEDKPRSAEATYQLARILREAGRFDEAVPVYEVLLEQDPESELAPHALFELGYCLSKQGSHTEAVRHWAELVHTYPESKLAEDALYQKAMGEIQLEKDVKARASLSALLRRYPKSARTGEALYWLGVLNAKAGRPEEAERALKKALGAATNADLGNKVTYQLALVMQKQGKEDEAVIFLQQLAGTDLADSMSPGQLEWLARRQLDRESYDAAAVAAQALLKNASEPAWRQIGWFVAGKAYAGAGRTEQARSAFAKAIEEQADTREGAEAALELGFLALGDEDVEDAAQAFDLAAKRATGEDLIDIRARSYYGLGLTSEACGERDEAVRYYLGVGVLFDHPDLVPECLFRAATFARRIRTLCGKPEDVEGAQGPISEQSMVSN